MHPPFLIENYVLLYSDKKLWFYLVYTCCLLLRMPLFKNVVEDTDKNLYYVKSELISHIVLTHQARHQQLDGLIMLYSK